MSAAMRRRPTSPAQWPFWLLLVAWVFANVPSTVALHTAYWLKGAGQFSHDAELRQDVASLLSGQPRATTPRLVPAATTQPQTPALPGANGQQKIDFALSPALLRLVAILPTVQAETCALAAPAGPVKEVPYPPPRFIALA